MGYDSGECIECYCRGHSNNCTNVVPRNICRECFLSHCPEGLTGRAQCQTYVRVGKKAKCDCCKAELTLCICSVAVCGRCLRDYWPPGAYNAENHTKEAEEADEDFHSTFEGYSSYVEERQWMWGRFIVDEGSEDNSAESDA